ncbi:MAG: hypothetical protein EZS28_047570, partial [Streblomastix strix]
MCICLQRDFIVLFINIGVNAHILYVSDVQALTGYRYCDKCKLQAFWTSNPNISRDLQRHMEKYKKNNETFEKFFLQKYGEDSTVISYLIPYCIASTVRNKSDMHSFCFDIRQANFLDQWLDQIFEEVKQIKRDNKYEDENIPQHFEVTVIGFNSAKLYASLMFKNLKSKNWRIIKHIGSRTVAKYIIVRHKDTHIQLSFVDTLIYCFKMSLQKFVRDIGCGTMQKGRFPYEYININNYATELDKSEPFPREVFENKLKNKSISEAKYQ